MAGFGAALLIAASALASPFPVRADDSDHPAMAVVDGPYPQSYVLDTSVVGHFYEPPGWYEICGPGALRVVLAFAGSDWTWKYPSLGYWTGVGKTNSSTTSAYYPRAGQARLIPPVRTT